MTVDLGDGANWTAIAAISQIAATVVAFLVGFAAIAVTLLQRRWQLQDARDSDRLAAHTACVLAIAGARTLEDLRTELNLMMQGNVVLTRAWETDLMGQSRATSNALVRIRAPDPDLARVVSYISSQCEATALRLTKGGDAIVEAAEALNETDMAREVIVEELQALHEAYEELTARARRRLRFKAVEF